MTDSNQLSRLSDLPLPLAPAQPHTRNALAVLATEPRSTYPSPPETDQVTQPPASSLPLTEELSHLPHLEDSLITAEKLNLKPRQFKDVIAQLNLVEIMHGVYRPAHCEETPLLRAHCLSLLTPADYLYRLRFSRLTAAWALGYVDITPTRRIDVDYDRNYRCNLPRHCRSIFYTHQSRYLPFDTMAVGPISLTTPLRTALDLLLYHDTVEAIDAVAKILADPTNSVTPQLFTQYLEDQPNVPAQVHRAAGYLTETIALPPASD